MAPDVRTITGPVEAPQEKRRGFHPFESMAEGLRMRRARRDAFEALESAARFGESESFGEALAVYTALPQKQKERVLLELQGTLKAISYLPLEDENKTRRLTVIADFFANAALLLPTDAEGERITAPYKETIRILRETVERDEMRRSGDTAHSCAILACAKALWELEYGNFGFWEGRTMDLATRDYTITKLLEMPDCGEITEHGWYLLRGNLDALGPSIARSPSPKKEEFFRSMLMDADMSVVKSALKGAICLERTPSDFTGIAEELSTVPGMETAAQNFVMAAVFKGQLAEAGDKRLLAAKHLVVYYADGMKAIGDLLERTAREMAGEALSSEPGSQDYLKRLDVLVTMASAGIAPYSTEELAKLLSPLTTTRAAVATFYNLTQNLMVYSQRQDLKDAAAELESARVNACFADLSYADDRQYAAAMELVLLYSTGRVYLVQNGMIPHVAQDMVEILLEPAGETAEQKTEQVAKAQKVLDYMRQVGIDVQINQAPAEPSIQSEGPEEGMSGVDGGISEGDGGSITDGGVTDE